MISYRLSNGREGDITDPLVLGIFWYRVYRNHLVHLTNLALKDWHRTAAHAHSDQQAPARKCPSSPDHEPSDHKPSGQS
jgi:hypothetical protein